MKRRSSQALLLLATLLSASFAQAGLIQTPRTGQATCWNDSGTVIDCTGTGQDGELMMGATLPTPRFTDNGDGTLTDSLTGLVWLKNAHCNETLANVAVTYIGYPVNPNIFGFSWQHALTWVTGLSSGHCGLTDGSNAGDWRLPNRNELSSILSKSDLPITSLTSQGFTNVDINAYWTSTTFAPGPSGASSVSFNNSNSNSAAKATIYDVFPVRDPR